ncbi:phospholipase C/P1 nuclease domain-containing protein [Cubamyces lactineus]|nr:phospholipase C/P1 nuclease domain-containing protein [Cubamyces lactineus]
MYAVSLPFLAIFSALASLPKIQAWDAPAHEVVATIAQIHLPEPVLSLVCDILYPSESNSTIGSTSSRTTETHSAPCYLASIATWADQIRTRPEYRYTAPMHYINALDDSPPHSCAFPGEQGWQGPPTANILAALANVTSVLRSFAHGERSPDAAEEALKFLVHFVGEMHQPLHISGRGRGNGVSVTWDGEAANLHWVWDGLLTERAIRVTPHNYSRPLTGPQAGSVEPHLRGEAYDPLVRRIMHEGFSIGGRFDPEKEAWSDCPKSRKVASHLQALVSAGWEASTGSARQLVSSNEMGGDQAVLDMDRHVALDPPDSTPPGVEKGWDDDVLCPYAWAQQVHSLNCGSDSPVWPYGLDGPEEGETLLGSGPGRQSQELEAPPELNTPAYSGRIAQDWVVERLLAMAGVRLANVLTDVLAEVAGAETV